MKLLAAQSDARGCVIAGPEDRTVGRETMSFGGRVRMSIAVEATR
jgi:hypothetical protein